MDLWVIAAAAGAGYIAKNLQNCSLDNNVQSESRNFLQQLRDKTCPLRRLGRKRGQDDDALFAEIDKSGKRDRESGVDDGIVEGYYNMGLVSSLPPVFSVEEFEDGESRNLRRANRGGKFTRNRGCGVHSVRPLNYLGSSLDAHLFRESGNVEDELDDTILYPFVSTLRPLLVTDRKIKRPGGDSYFTQFEGFKEEGRGENGVSSKATDKMLSSSSLGQFESVEGIKKLQEDDVFGKSFHSQGPNAMLVFITGMAVGIMSSNAAWKDEVDKLSKQLKQMHNLVEDLHEELDMKEMVMVKELTDTPLSIKEPIASPSDVKAFSKSDTIKADDREAENRELLSKIEVELQAELEMLEHNLKASALERISGVVEIDPDFGPDIVRGDLDLTMINGKPESENETTATINNKNHYRPANYGVSPWELSLRLHELIESKLESRIKELEMALYNSQNSSQLLDSQSIVSVRKFEYSESETSSSHHSPTCICYEHDEGEDTQIFSSNHVDALYKERNGILVRMMDNNQENEDGESSIRAVDQGKYSRNSMWNENRYSVLRYDGAREEVDRQRSTKLMWDEDCLSEDVGSDELDALMIKQIVERRKSGSSFNLEVD